MYRSCCYHTLRKCPHGIAQHTQTHHNTLQHTSRHSTGQQRTTQPSQVNPARRSTNLRPAHRGPSRHLQIQRSEAQLPQRVVQLPRARPGYRNQLQSALSRLERRQSSFGPRLVPPDSPAAQAWVKADHDECVDTWMHPTQPASVREARTCRRGKPSGRVTRSLWLLWLLWAPLALVLAAIPPLLCDFHVHPPTQRTASAGSTTDRRQQTIVRKCTSLPRPALWRIYPPRLPGRCQPALTLRAMHTCCRLPRSQTRGR